MILGGVIMTANVEINNRKDILLLLLYSPGISKFVNEPIEGKTRLVKMLFLFKIEVLPHFRRNTKITEDNFYEFFPWDFGPFSAQVYDDIAFFMLRDFVESSASEGDGLPESAAEWEKWLQESGSRVTDDDIDEYEEELFRLTESGIKFTKNLYDTLSSTQKQLLIEFKARLVQAPLRAILKYVYTKYPESAQRSKIKEDIVGHSF
jgi:uncharacterized protein YwgA